MTAGVAGACSTLTGDCFSSDLTSFLPPCRLLLKLSIVRMISFILFFFVRFNSRKYCKGELNHTPYLRRHCSQYSMSRLISTTSASRTCQCASSEESTLIRSDLASFIALVRSCTKSLAADERQPVHLKTSVPEAAAVVSSIREP